MKIALVIGVVMTQRRWYGIEKSTRLVAQILASSTTLSRKEMVSKIIFALEAAGWDSMQFAPGDSVIYRPLAAKLNIDLLKAVHVDLYTMVKHALRNARDPSMRKNYTDYKKLMKKILSLWAISLACGLLLDDEKLVSNPQERKAFSKRSGGTHNKLLTLCQELDDEEFFERFCGSKLGARVRAFEYPPMLFEPKR